MLSSEVNDGRQHFSASHEHEGHQHGEGVVCEVGTGPPAPGHHLQFGPEPHNHHVGPHEGMATTKQSNERRIAERHAVTERKVNLGTN